jgi:Fic family protein
LEPRREDYIDHLLHVSQTGNFEPWVRFFAEGVRAQAKAAADTITRLVDFSNEVIETLKRAGERTGAVVLTLASNLIGYPVMTVSRVAGDLEVSYPTANTAIAKLVKAGYLREVTGGNYGRVFRCDRVYDVLAGQEPDLAG